MKKWISILTALCLLVCLLPASIRANAAAAVDTVSVYLSISHDEEFVVGKESGEVMAMKQIDVPYFDLELYGLQDFYFSSESYGDDGDGLPGSNLQAGTKEFAYGKITALHLLIYATEVYYCGIDEADAGKGYLAQQNLLGTTTMTITGSVGSIFFNNIWGMDLNLNYYLNYQYPLASPGWGSTADQILLHDGDILTLGHFTSYDFHKDPDSVFNFIKSGDDTGHIGAVKGEKLELTVCRAGASEGNDYTTAQKVLTSCPDVYLVPVNAIESDVTQWTYLGTANASGKITLDTSTLDVGQYMIAIPGQYGSEYTKYICSTPGGIMLDVVESGDIDGNSKINAMDAAAAYAFVNGKRDFSVGQETAADVNGDGKINVLDTARIYQFVNGKLTQLGNG